MYKALIRPLLFMLPAETAHHFTFNLLKLMHLIPGVGRLFRSLFTYQNPKLEKELFGLTFPNPVGLAAGFDKDATLIDELSTLGFGFIEIGTLTPKPQSGNKQPRLFRLPLDQSLINRMGFNNRGVKDAVERLRKRESTVLVGGNIGKNKVTPNDKAEGDYLLCFEALFDHVDYFVVNVSSPNTPNLRDLQEKEPLKKLLVLLETKNQQKPKRKPLLLKIAPDLTHSQLDDVLEIVTESGIDGIIATNTTISREGLSTPANKVEAMGAGGLSGRSVGSRSTEVIRYLHQNSNGHIPIIGVGGIFNAQDALEKLKAGASLVQVYTGFVYEGPDMIRRINRELSTQEF